ncbi:MAG: type II toxin-antitoxin system VapC family toxin [Rhizobiaceae bacterium]|nr:type II toxin-antitoxin system VapC family toxin [Rhizobiaceae bacterium]
MIVDANVATYWFVDTPMSPAARDLLARQDLSAPTLARWEMARTLQKYMRAGIVTPDLPRTALERVSIYIPVWIGIDEYLPAAWDIALQENHIVYDCLYLALALERSESFATADRRLAALSHKLGVETVLVEAR